MKVLIVLTSHSKLGNTGNKTGFWLEEFASPYYALKDAGAEITLASPQGGQPPLDPKSDEPDAKTEATQRFSKDVAAQAQLANTVELADVSAGSFDAVFYPGGHGPLWDLYSDANSIALIQDFIAAEKYVAAVCHAPAVLLKAKDPNGRPLLEGKKVTGFSNSEEAAVELTDVVPYLLEDELMKVGGIYQKVEDWHPLAVVDGLVITGQNPASSQVVAQALLQTAS
ncbi:type 1 glutamine amidotransferase domain-containing protein [Pseudomonadales bacterium]|jgi:putative intracellular protease/amidase|nr:type 1 glutamine amidotransferase domain-containing protein [Pseudomonadales bacterium]MDA8965756.1 type 1 glutamine amidotransferase domain-containing protein [Pseudomonadales bacterium]MDB4421082.1 type 1 glutamine amidotransferase domain-containing protein [Pseudomonadales bacterium]MDB4529241.1 type 1 glutamine amidotransferase domain-containing protein [Pseudomonadales bacterium]MDB4542141.1 type 1 glutamine amidotransferase domain-containing protein [Pseudomonadales bacterium]